MLRCAPVGFQHRDLLRIPSDDTEPSSDRIRVRAFRFEHRMKLVTE